MMKKLLSSVALCGICILGVASTPALAATGEDSADVSAVEHEDPPHENLGFKALDVGGPTGNTERSAKFYDYYYPGGMNGTEFRYCLRHPIKCAKAQAAAEDALSRAEAIYPAETLYQGTGDAFRHCYWSARMTIDLGEETAKTIGDNHEAETEDGEDKNMDLSNNRSGRIIGKTASNYGDASKTCQAKTDNGELVTLK